MPENTPARLTRRQLLRATAIAAGAAAVSPVLAGTAIARDAASADEGAARVLAMVRRPHFPKRRMEVTRFGAVGDGTTDCTRAFADAIAACHRAGGGRVAVPAGRYATGPIHLLSNVELHLEKGSTLAFSTDPAAYPNVFSRWQGIELMNFSPLIYAYGQRNIAVTGDGVLDGQASTADWWSYKAFENKDFAALEAMANAGVPPERRVFGQGFHMPPPFFQPYRCENVLIEGVTLRNSPFWHLNPTLCRSVTVENVTVDSSGPNTDGCDPESCDGVVISGVHFNTGDDCIAIKSGRNTDGRRVNTPCQNILIQGCHFANGHGGVTIGSEMTGGVRNVYGRDLTMNSPILLSGHRIKTNSVRGGYVRNVHIERVSAGTIGGPALLIDYNYGEGDTGTFLPTVTDINLRDWTVASCAPGWQIAGYSNDPIGTVNLTNVAISAMTGTSTATDVTSFTLDNVTVAGKPVTS